MTSKQNEPLLTRWNAAGLVAFILVVVCYLGHQHLNALQKTQELAGVISHLEGQVLLPSPEQEKITIITGMGLLYRTAEVQGEWCLLIRNADGKDHLKKDLLEIRNAAGMIWWTGTVEEAGEFREYGGWIGPAMFGL